MATNKQCMTRLQKEYRSLLKEPVPHITAHPSSSLLEWHFVLEGTQEFEGGVYHGKIVFPPQYPFKPPSISLFTPNGRFATNTKLCLSMTDYHPESWNPMWSVGTILTGLLSFMHDTMPTTGSITSSKAEKAKLAKDSLAFNVKHPAFRKLFPEWLAKHEALQKEAEKQQEPQQEHQPTTRDPAPGEAVNAEAQDSNDTRKATVAATTGKGSDEGAEAAGQKGAAEAEAQRADKKLGRTQTGTNQVTVIIAVAIVAIAVLPWISSTLYPTSSA